MTHAIINHRAASTYQQPLRHTPSTPSTPQEITQQFKDHFAPSRGDAHKLAFRNSQRILNAFVDSKAINTNSKLASTLGKVGVYAGAAVAALGGILLLGPAVGVAATTALGGSATVGYAVGLGAAALEATQLGVIGGVAGGITGAVTSHIGAGLNLAKEGIANLFR